VSADPGWVPAAFGAYFAGLEEQGYGEGGRLYDRCFGCGPAHPGGLHVRCFRSGDGVVAPIVIPAVYEGPPGASHGGIVAAYLDEVLGAMAARACGRPAVTGELTVRYVRPVPLETPLLGRGSLLVTRDRYVEVEGRLEEFGRGRVLATARGRFFPVRPSSGA
jgi:acyl-coenzyme A thioesterase PaaI-like protein